MSLRRSVALALFISAVVLVPLGGPLAATAAANPFPSASETYYKLDVPNGTMSVIVETLIQNGTGKDATAVPLYTLPTASNIVVKRDDVVLATKITAGSEKQEQTGVVLATVAPPMKANARANFVMTYDVPAHTGDLIRMEPGVIETTFIGQGTGSFVFVDVPSSGENFFDPGCLKQNPQSSDANSRGSERWVCGDVAVIALNTNHPDVLKRCAALDDKCRQRESASGLFSAFVQSITDTTTRGKLEADLAMKDGTKKLVFRFFRRDQAWAEKQFAVAQQALPKLEEVFGYPYPNGQRISMRQSHQIQLVGAAGIAFPEQGEVLLAPHTGFDEEVTVHELAHQWAGFNLTEGWLWEGLAEYAMRSVAPSLGVKPGERKWQSLSYKDPLVTWRNGSLVGNPDYWYGKASAFWFAYETAIGGPENMKKVLALTSPLDSRSPFDGRWFMDNGERVSGANLDRLFLEWVFNPTTAASLLSERRTIYDSLAVLNGKAVSLGLNGTPSDIFDNLDVWSFAAVPAQIARGSTILDAYAKVVALGTEAGLPTSRGVAASWGKRTLTETAAVIEQQRLTAQVLRDASKQVASEPPQSSPSEQLMLANEKFEMGDYADASRLASTILNGASNLQAASEAIAIARGRQAAFSPGFVEKIGLAMKDPNGDLAAAEAAYTAGDGATALVLAQSAIGAWDASQARGLRFLSILVGTICAISAAAWILVRRNDASARRAMNAARDGRAGHELDASEPKSRWKEWDNIP
ncbi:MAG: hypothetical protein ABI939_11415 [Anaerolineaceae bacterium]